MTPGVTAGVRFRSWTDMQANAARGAGGLAVGGWLLHMYGMPVRRIVQPA